MQPKVIFLFLLLFLFPVGCGKDKGTEPKNQPPVIEDMSATLTTVEKGGFTTIRVEAKDADGDDLTYSWIYEPGSITGNGESVIWTAPATPGIYRIRVTVSDGQSEVTDSIIIEVTDTPPNPKVIGTITIKVADPKGNICIGCFKKGTLELVTTSSMAATLSMNSSESYQIELPATFSDSELDIRAWDDVNINRNWNEDEIISDPEKTEYYLEYADRQWYAVSRLDNSKQTLSSQTPINIVLYLPYPPPPVRK